MNLYRSRLVVGVAAALVVGAMLVPFSANAATRKLGSPFAPPTVASMLAKLPIVIQGGFSSFTFVDALRFWKQHHFID